MDKTMRQQKPLVKNLKTSVQPENMNTVFTKSLFVLLIVAAILGSITGYVLGTKKGASGSTLTTGNVESSEIKKGTIVGSDDTKTFKDTAIGKLANGGIDGEGQFHLVREGGESQNVYLTSSGVDLSKFVGKKIKIWGQTQAAQHAGWLMDVGRVEVLE